MWEGNGRHRLTRHSILIPNNNSNPFTSFLQTGPGVFSMEINLLLTEILVSILVMLILYMYIIRPSVLDDSPPEGPWRFTPHPPPSPDSSMVWQWWESEELILPEFGRPENDQMRNLEDVREPLRQKRIERACGGRSVRNSMRTGVDTNR